MGRQSKPSSMPANRTVPTPDVCPACGADVPAGAEACPECGSDRQTGWNEEASALDGLDLPDEAFDYDEFVRREFGITRRGRPVWPATAISAAVLLALFILFLWLNT